MGQCRCLHRIRTFRLLYQLITKLSYKDAEQRVRDVDLKILIEKVIADTCNTAVQEIEKFQIFIYGVPPTDISLDLNPFRKRDLKDKPYKWGYSTKEFFLGMKIMILIDYETLTPL